MCSSVQGNSAAVPKTKKWITHSDYLLQVVIHMYTHIIICMYVHNVTLHPFINTLQTHAEQHSTQYIRTSDSHDMTHTTQCPLINSTVHAHVTWCVVYRNGARTSSQIVGLESARHCMCPFEELSLIVCVRSCVKFSCSGTHSCSASLTRMVGAHTTLQKSHNWKITLWQVRS